MMADPSSFSTSSSSPPLVLPCREFSEFKVRQSAFFYYFFIVFFFQEALEGARKVDDGIIYRLNTSIPTTSFKGEVSAADKCKELYEEVRQIIIIIIIIIIMELAINVERVWSIV